MLRPEIQLSPGEVHLWIHKIELDPLRIRRHTRFLSPQELSRAERFIHQTDYDKYILFHGTSREILAKYLDLSPGEIVFQSEPSGKPILPSAINPLNLNFNLSHSGQWLALALVRNARVGVDIEEIPPESASLDVAKRFFTPWENEELLTLSGQEQVVGFFNCWTRKEAYLKAIGCGLAVDPQQCEVTLRPGDVPKIRRHILSESQTSQWSLFDFSLAHVIAAVAVDLPKPCIHFKN